MLKNMLAMALAIGGCWLAMSVLVATTSSEVASPLLGGMVAGLATGGGGGVRMQSITSQARRGTS